MGGDWQQWHVQAGDVGADGLAEGYEGLWVGIESGAADHDQVSLLGFPPPFYPWCLRRWRFWLTDSATRYQVKNIRELLGHKVDLNFVESNPAVRLERD